MPKAELPNQIGARSRNNLPVLVIVEGLHDVEFLRRISRMLAAKEPSVPNLGQWEVTGQIALLPIGGNGPQPWLDRLTPLGKAEFFLFDRELPPETAVRPRAVAGLNTVSHRRAFLTTKRSLECYLHPAAIHAAGGVTIQVGDDTPVAELAAQQQLTDKYGPSAWKSLSQRTRKRLRDRAKRWLNREAVDRMTPARLAERDSQGEVRRWLHTIGDLVARSA